MGLNDEIRNAAFGSYQDAFQRFKSLSTRYGDLSMDKVTAAFARATSTEYERNDPYIQNRRVKAISSLPVEYTKDKVAEMLINADNNEQPLRSVEHALEITAYPLFHLRKVYQDLLTYHSYTAPAFTDKSDAEKPEFKREWMLIEKLRRELCPTTQAHRIAGQAMQEGKVFYYPRFKVDKPHNRVEYAFMQQIPSDWTKIVGYNNKSKYTVAFNLFYFMEPGTDYLQFGDLFKPYMEDFYSVTEPPASVPRGTVYASRTSGRANLAKFKQIADERGGIFGNPDVYRQNGRWFYWVTLPVDKIFTFEIDDTATNVISPFTGLFLNMIQLAQYEQIQLELIQSPLISLLTGEIPYREDKSPDASDAYKLSISGRRYFETLWYQMLAANNTNGIGLYFAPVENMKLHQLAETPSAIEISNNGYSYTVAKAGMSGIIPTTGDPKAGLANISLQIESRFAQPIYRSFERMMQVIFERLNLKYEWNFRMFGDVATDKQTLENVKSEMTLGLSHAAIIYNAMYDRSIFDDIAASSAISALGLLDIRRPLATSYSGFTKTETNVTTKAEVNKELNPGGRPRSEEVTSEGNEKDKDNPVEGEQ